MSMQKPARPRPTSAKSTPRRSMARATLIPVVVAAAATLVAAGLLPVVAPVGAAVKDFNDRFFSDASGPIDIPTFPERSTIYAADGSVLATLFLDENRKAVTLDQVNENTRNAVLAIEDHDFYRHGPVDVSSVIRAAIANLRAGRIVQGGSTISQQLVKNTETGGEQTFERKFREAQAAIQLERQYSKDEILEMYLNQIYLGHRVYGIGTAAEWYFNRPIEELGLAQAALLAGMIAAPAAYDPLKAKDAALVRRNRVLADMLKYDWITQEEYERAVARPIKLSAAGRNANENGPEAYWVSFVVRQFLKNPRFGKTVEDRRRVLFQGGLNIYTTLRPQLQQTARTIIKNHLPNSGPQPPADPQGALVSIVPQTGAITTMVGGTDYSKQQIDLASQGSRSTGSAFKAFTLVAAIEQGIPPGKVYSSKSPATITDPRCRTFGGPWQPYNAEGAGDLGYMDLWEATADSINVVFAQLVTDVGPDKVRETAMRMGLSGYIPEVCSITLGAVAVSPLSMTSAYATLANNGIHCAPFAISRVTDRTGKPVFRTKPNCKRVVDAEVAAQVTAMLQGVVTHGTGTAATLGRPVAGKTGTGQEYQDAWFMGYVPQVCTGVWVGYSKDEIPMRGLRVLGGGNAFGGTIAAPIWHDFMVAAVRGLPVKGFPAPPPPRSGKIPNVVGEKREDAERILADANFTPIVKETASDKPAGTVVSQSPKGGSTAPLGSGVTIMVSNGKGPATPGGNQSGTVTVPDVIGMHVNRAVAVLESYGLDAFVEREAVADPSQDDVVLGQRPQPGERVRRGAAVVITVGKFEKG